MKRLSPFCVALAALGLAAPAHAADAVPDAIAAAVASVGRPPTDMAHDAARHPAALLLFARIKPGEAVAELGPGSGYYTRMLSKVVGANGHVYAVVPQRGFRDLEQARELEARAKAEGKPAQKNPVDAILPIAHITEFDNIMVTLQALDPYGGNFGLPVQADAVFSAGYYHQLHEKVPGTVRTDPLDMVAVNKAIFRAMNPGADYVVIDDAAAKGAGFAQVQTLHRSDPEAVKAEIMAAGFTLDGESSLLANPKDDHTKPPNDPSLNGAPDRFVLRFIKPVTASAETKRPKTDILKNYYGNSFVLGTPDKRFRTIFYHQDGSYQEFGQHDMQSATFYWDADGHNCMYHEFPAEQEGFVVCHPFNAPEIAAKVGDEWHSAQGNGEAPIVTLMKGYQYPNYPTWPKE